MFNLAFSVCRIVYFVSGQTVTLLPDQLTRATENWKVKRGQAAEVAYKHGVRQLGEGGHLVSSDTTTRYLTKSTFTDEKMCLLLWWNYCGLTDWPILEWCLCSFSFISLSMLWHISNLSKMRFYSILHSDLQVTLYRHSRLCMLWLNFKYTVHESMLSRSVCILWTYVYGMYPMENKTR